MRSYDNDVSREVYFRYRFSSSPFWVQIGLNHFFGTNEALLSIREVFYTWKTIFQSITDAKNGWKVWVGRRKIKNSSVWTYKNILFCMCSTPKELLAPYKLSTRVGIVWISFITTLFRMFFIRIIIRPDHDRNLRDGFFAFPSSFFPWLHPQLNFWVSEIIFISVAAQCDAVLSTSPKSLVNSS